MPTLVIHQTGQRKRGLQPLASRIRDQTSKDGSLPTTSGASEHQDQSNESSYFLDQPQAALEPSHQDITSMPLECPTALLDSNSELECSLSSFQDNISSPAMGTVSPAIFPISSTTSLTSSPQRLHDEFDLFFMLPNTVSMIPPSISSSPAFQTSESDPEPDLVTSTQDRQTAGFSFPDDYLLTVSELDLLRACMCIAFRLGCSDQIWDLTSISPFYNGPSPSHSGASSSPHRSSLSSILPDNLVPTPAQRQLSHHPVLDILPWPTVRDKLIHVFDQPVELRPLAARGNLSLVQLVYDMEDSAEGIRVWGADPCDSGNWEVGQVFFQRWWWALDREVVEKSNEWRRCRGAGCLDMEKGA